MTSFPRLTSRNTVARLLWVAALALAHAGRLWAQEVPPPESVTLFRKGQVPVGLIQHTFKVGGKDDKNLKIELPVSETAYEDVWASLTIIDSLGGSVAIERDKDKKKIELTFEKNVERTVTVRYRQTVTAWDCHYVLRMRTWQKPVGRWPNYYLLRIEDAQYAELQLWLRLKNDTGVKWGGAAKTRVLLRDEAAPVAGVQGATEADAGQAKPAAGTGGATASAAALSLKNVDLEPQKTRVIQHIFASGNVVLEVQEWAFTVVDKGNAVRQLRLRNKTQEHLPPGIVHVFDADAPFGEAALDDLATDATKELKLPDERIKVVRRQPLTPVTSAVNFIRQGRICFEQDQLNQFTINHCGTSAKRLLLVFPKSDDWKVMQATEPVRPDGQTRVAVALEAKQRTTDIAVKESRVAAQHELLAHLRADAIRTRFLAEGVRRSEEVTQALGEVQQRTAKLESVLHVQKQGEDDAQLQIEAILRRQPQLATTEEYERLRPMLRADEQAIAGLQYQKVGLQATSAKEAKAHADYLAGVNADAELHLHGGFIQFWPEQSSLYRTKPSVRQNRSVDGCPDRNVRLNNAERLKKVACEMKAAKVRTIIIQYLRYDGVELFGPDGGPDPIATLLNYAEANGLQVYLGLSFDRCFWEESDAGKPRWQDPELLRQEAADNAAFACQIAKRYWKFKDSRAFAGWYIPHELGNEHYDPKYAAMLRDFYRTISQACKAASNGKPVAISPYFEPETRLNAVSVGESIASLLQGSSVDIVMLQDGVGREGWDKLGPHLAPYFWAVRKACDRSQVRLWGNVESYATPTVEDAMKSLVPADIDRLERQMRAVHPYVEQLVTFDFYHFMSPSRGAAQKKLYDDYRRRFIEQQVWPRP